MKAEVSFYLDTRRAKKNGTFPLKLHVYYPIKNEKLFPLDYSFTQEDFEACYINKKPKKEFQETRIELDAIIAKATEIARELGELVTFEKFERKMFRTKARTNNVIDHFADKQAELEENEQIGTALSYDCAIKSILEFFNSGKKHNLSFLAFTALAPDVLRNYEKWMISQGNSKTTVGIYMRNLRHIFKRAIKAGIVHAEFYPFLEYKIPNGKNIKKALEKPELNKLFTAKLKAGSEMQKARDFWFFSYQCNGMNIRDICELKWKDVNSTYFSFLRHKTINTTKEDPIPIVVPMTDYISNFIEKYGNSKGKPNEYVFPVFLPDMDAKARHKANQNFVRFINQHMEKLCEKLGMETKGRTMEARHSFATQVTRTLGLEFTQEALGHTTLMTTQNYWKGFEQQAKKDMADKLLDFSEPKPVKEKVKLRKAKRAVRKSIAA